MKLEEMRKIAKKRTRGEWNYNSKGCHEAEIGDIEFNHPQLGKTAIGWVYWSNDDAKFIAMAANNFDKLLAVVEAANRMAEMYHFQEVEGEIPTSPWLAHYYKVLGELEKE